MKANLSGINPALHDMIKRNQLSENKIAELIRLKQTVERFSVKPYATESEIKSLKDKFGSEPDVKSWSDYFQTEIGSRHFDLTDDEFAKITATVRFDLISSVKIFQGKQDCFLEEIYSHGLEAMSISQEKWSATEKEAVHLYILRNYFIEMGLEECKTSEEDEEWFSEFVGRAEAAAG